MLEHVRDPLANPRIARNPLMKDGPLFVTVPNHSSLTQLILGKWDRYVVHEHLTYFKPKVLRAAIENCGFQVIGKATWGFNPLFLMKDLLHRGQVYVNCQRAARDAAWVLKVKRSMLYYLGDPAQKTLNLFSAADPLAMVAMAV